MGNRLHLVHELDVFAHGAGVRVGLAAAQVLAHVRLPSDVRLHVLGPVAGVVEPLLAPVVVAFVRFLPRVGPNVQLEIFQPGELALALGEVALVRSLPRVAAQVGDELVPGVKWAELPRASLPQAYVRLQIQGVVMLQVSHQQLQRAVLLATSFPTADGWGIGAVVVGTGQPCMESGQ